MFRALFGVKQTSTTLYMFSISRPLDKIIYCHLIFRDHVLQLKMLFLRFIQFGTRTLLNMMVRRRVTAHLVNESRFIDQWMGLMIQKAPKLFLKAIR